MAKKTKTIKTNVYRSAKTGRFVSKKYTQKHKDTTVKETVKKKKARQSRAIYGGIR